MNKEKDKQEKNFLRERFINRYCKSRGWNPNSLSVNQMMEILSKSEYKNPKLKLE